MATLRDPDALQPIVTHDPAVIVGDRQEDEASDRYELCAEDRAAIEAGERDVAAGRFATDEEMRTLFADW